jgi:DNA-binding beta-propeller fold protein YncE
VQLNENGTLNQVIVTGLTGSPALYLCANPANGHLFVSTGWCHKIYDVDPVAKTATVWLSTLTAPAQMAFSEDGQMLFVTMDTNPGDILGIDATTKTTIFDYATLNTSSPLNKPTGVAVGSGSLERDLFVTCEDGTVWQIDRGDATATMIASSRRRIKSEPGLT